MGIFKEFKNFAVKGNMIDMAFGIIIGASFNKVVDVLVKHVLMPPLSLLTKGLKFQDKRFVIREKLTDTVSGDLISDEVAIGYGALVEAFTDFIVIGFTIFLLVRFLNRLRERANEHKPKAVPATPKDIELLTQLTELMKEQNALLKKEK